MGKTVSTDDTIASPHGDGSCPRSRDDTAIFFDPNQARDPRGQWTEMGRGEAMRGQVRAPGGPTPGLNVDEEQELRAQVSQVARLRKGSAFDRDAMRGIAEEEGHYSMAYALDHLPRESYASLLADASPGEGMGDTGDTGGMDAERVVHVNLGITPSRSQPVGEVSNTEAYYGSTRYKGWLTDLTHEAQHTGVEVQDVTKATGLWGGAVEPSASVWVKGNARSIRQFAANMGAEYNQEGVMLFEPDRDDGVGALYTLPGLKEAQRQDAVDAMKKAGVDGGRIVAMRSGGYVLEITDADGTLMDKVEALRDALGTDLLATPGRVTMLEGGKDYERRGRPAPGRGMTHSRRAAEAISFSARTVLGLFAKEPRPTDRDDAWRERGFQVHKAPRGSAQVNMRGGHNLIPFEVGDRVEVYTTEKLWQGTTTSGEPLVALKGPYEAATGQDNEGELVVLVGMESAHSIRAMGLEGQEVPAHLVRKAGGKGRSMNRDAKGKVTQGKRKETRVDVQPSPHGDPKRAAFYVGIRGIETVPGVTPEYEVGPPNLAAFGGVLGEVVAFNNYLVGTNTVGPGQPSKPFKGVLVSGKGQPNRWFNPLQLRDPQGRWVETGAGDGPKQMRYRREHEAVEGDEGLGTGTDPGVKLSDNPIEKAARVHLPPTPAQWTAGAEMLAKYNASPGEMRRNLRAMVERVSLENREQWRTWYYDTADVAEEIARETGTNFTQVAMAIAALSPQVLWGWKSAAERPQGRTTNQNLATAAMALVGNRANDVVTITPEFVQFMKEANGVNMQAYDGTDITVEKGGNYLGEQRIADLPADVLAEYFHDEHRGMDENFALAIMLGRTQDPDLLGGPKTRSFYNNIRHPELSEDATIDVFMARLLSGHRDLSEEELQEMTSGIASYIPMSQALADVAHEYGWKPHELQAVVWIQEHLEAARVTDPSITAEMVYTDPKHISKNATTTKKRVNKKRQQYINEQRAQMSTPENPLPPIVWVKPDAKTDPEGAAAWEASGGFNAEWWKGRFWVDDITKAVSAEALPPPDEPRKRGKKKT